MPKADFLVDLLGLVFVGQDRWIFSDVEDLETGTDEFDLPGIHLRVASAIAHPHGSGHGDDRFPAKAAGWFHDLVGNVLLVEDDLGDAASVAEIDEDEALALISVGVDPTAECGFVFGIGSAEFTAHVGSLEHGRVDP